jgi:pimeloyl-ACP methyl ester carboxylesterase
VIVLQAETDCSTQDGKEKAGAASFDAERCAELMGQSQDSTRGKWRVVEGASHMIMHDKPDVVLDAFADVIQAARLSGLATAEPR